MRRGLPRGWLEPSWVEHFCTLTHGDGTIESTSAATDHCGLYLWVKFNLYKDLKPFQYRAVIRRMSGLDGAGYSSSALTSSLRQVLRRRVRTHNSVGGVFK